MSETKYDFDFITGALGLVPYYGGALNPAQIVKIDQSDTGFCYIHLRDFANEGVRYQPIQCSPQQMCELESAIRKRQDEVKKNQYEAMKEQIRQQAMAVEELNSAPRPAHGIPIIGGNKRRQ